MNYSFLIVLLGVIIFYVIATYNKFVTTKARIKASIQEIGNQLKRQADLIPNLVASVKGYMKHEKGIFDQLTKARTAMLEAAEKNDPQKMINESANAQRLFGRFQALAEDNPELKAVETVNKLMEELRDTADKGMYSRRVLIDLTADYNIMTVKFPCNLVAMIFNFKSEKGLVTPEEGEHLEVGEKETVAPKVEL